MNRFRNLFAFWRASALVALLAWGVVIGMVWRMLVLGGSNANTWAFFLSMLVALGASFAYFTARLDVGDKTAPLWRPSTIIATGSWLSVIGMLWYLFFEGGGGESLAYLFVMIIIAFIAMIATFANSPTPKTKVNVVERTTIGRRTHERSGESA